jgi:hypothetical protein
MYAEAIPLLKQLSKLNARRNDIAHGMVLQDFGRGGGNYLCPNWANPKKYNPHQPHRHMSEEWEAFSFAYTAKQVNLYASHFQDFADKLHKLTRSFPHFPA